nr:immunoglobulin heavy chain junction region [Mus musculus]
CARESNYWFAYW